ncbi:MAG: hypothetical protein IPN44_10215 [Flavobacteriales bacterium]|nr:hypothetical protein [Flavobacteriales bacterium]
MNVYHLGLLLAFTAFATSLPAQDGTNKIVQVVFTQKMDQGALDSIQRVMKPLGVDLQVHNTKFEAGLLRTIDFTIVTPNGTGSARGEIRPDRRFGFICDPKAGSKFAVVVGDFGPTPASTLAVQDSSNDVVEVVFTQYMDLADLDSIQKAVRPFGVDLQINGTEYKDGLLHSIDFNIVTPRGPASAKGEIRSDRKFGFRYDPKGDKKVAVEVGTLDRVHAEEEQRYSPYR